MKGKTIFTRDATRKNLYIREQPYPMNSKYIICDTGVVIEQYSPLCLKQGWNIFSREGRVYAQSPAPSLQMNPMAAIRGDESPLSYIQAAVCFHDLLRYSSEGPSLNIETILDDVRIRMHDLFGWWSFGKLPRSLNPIFFYDSLLHPVVIIFTHQYEVIKKNIHRFDHQGYELKFHQQTWATHGDGTLGRWRT